MARPKTAASGYRKIILRLPEEMLKDCKNEAEKARRSLNAQLLCVIEDWLNNGKMSEGKHANSGER